MALNLTTPLLMALALLNVALLFFRASRRLKLGVGVAIAGLASVLLKDWLEGLLYLLQMP